MVRPHSRTDTAGELSSPIPATTSPSRQDHPLSPSNHPTLTRRLSSVPNEPPDYFTATSSSTKNVHDRRKTNATDTDLLGIGPSRRLAPVKVSSNRPIPDSGPSPANGMQRTRSKRPWKVFLQSLSREELAVVDTDFDGMTEPELRAYLHSFSTSPRSIDITTEAESPLALVSPTSPLPIQPRASDAAPLFPPSPPAMTQQAIVDHPLRILSRAVRELREAVEQLEAENEALRLIKEAGGVRPKRNKQAHQLSIHEGLTEALATSLTDTPSISHYANANHPVIQDTASVRSMSPAPLTRRARSPTPSVRTVPDISSSPSAATSLFSVKSAEPPLAGSAKEYQANRSSWTSGLWVWSNGSKPKTSRPRKGSVGSIVSNTGTLRNVTEAAMDENNIPEDDEAWRNGDGGSSPAFRAIFLATRLITPDPLSILVSLDIHSTSLIAVLAHSLVSTARDKDIAIKEPPGRRRADTASLARSRADSVVSAEKRRTDNEDNVSRGYSDSARSATAAIGRSLLSTVSNATTRAKTYSVGLEDESVLSRPALLNRASSSRAYPTTAVSGGTFNHHKTPDLSQFDTETMPLPSVELSSIVADENRPPTVLLSRQQLGSFFQSSKAVPTLRTASRFKSGETPLTDRYGFIYDIQHTSMLKDANEAAISAPAALNGAVSSSAQKEVEGEGWIDRQRRKSQERPSASRRSTSSFDSRLPSPSATPRRSLESSSVAIASNQQQQPRSGTTTPSKDRSSSHPDVQRIRGSISVAMNPSPPKVVIAKDTLTVSARGSQSLHSQTDQSTANTSSSSSRSPNSTSLALPVENTPSTANSSRTTVSSLLDRLTTLHDAQQKERKKEWDTFLRQRKSKGKSKLKGTREDVIDDGPGTIGISQMGRGEEWKAFARLVRAGIPLAYRSDIWSECSGATDMMVPGEYAEIQSVHRQDTSPFIAEIEKDVTRTFPGNVFFGGDGPGVAKLRRVLVAYSWYNPEVGYCQGMNMLAATLLLTHTDEEQAYWTLVSILSRILPHGYYTPDLLSSRADQLVLAELVAQYVPKVHSHLEDLGVDLSSITFGWFLSLFTDCLPVETLFRVWDVFFVDGHDTLFRVAIAILKTNETGITSCESVSDLFTFMSRMTSRFWTADKLIALQHAYKPIIKHAEIRARCEKQAAQLADQAS